MSGSDRRDIRLRQFATAVPRAGRARRCSGAAGRIIRAPRTLPLRRPSRRIGVRRLHSRGTPVGLQIISRPPLGRGPTWQQPLATPTRFRKPERGAIGDRRQATQGDIWW